MDYSSLTKIMVYFRTLRSNIIIFVHLINDNDFITIVINLIFNFIISYFLIKTFFIFFKEFIYLILTFHYFIKLKIFFEFFLFLNFIIIISLFIIISLIVFIVKNQT
jgi:hypothetical protein